MELIYKVIAGVALLAGVVCLVIGLLLGSAVTVLLIGAGLLLLGCCVGGVGYYRGGTWAEGSDWEY